MVTKGRVLALAFGMALAWATQTRAEDAEETTISPTTAFEKATAGKAVLVDIRDKKRFDLFHAKNSVGLSPSEAKAKGYYKGKTVVILDDGFSPRAAEALQAESSRLGVNAQVVKGGMLAWRASDLPIEGDSAAPYEILPNECFAAANDADWTAIRIVPGGSTRKPLSRLAALNTITLSERDLNDVEKLKKTLAANMNASMPLMVYNLDGFGYRTIAARLRDTGAKNVFFLKDGEAGFSRFLSAYANNLPSRKVSAVAGPSGKGCGCGK